MTTQPTKGEPVAFTPTSLEAKWNSVHWRAGLPFPPVGCSCEVAGVNTDKYCDQDRAFSNRLVVAITPCHLFVCLQKEGCWPTIERLENCWFRVADIQKWGEPVAGTATPRVNAIHPTSIRNAERQYKELAGLLEQELTLALGKIAELQFERDSFLADRDALLLSRDTAREALAAVTAKLDEIRKECDNVEDILGGKYQLANTVLRIITQEEGKPTL